MYSDFLIDNCLFGSGTDGIFGDTILCIGIFYFCGVDAFIIGIFVIEFINCIGSSECARALSYFGFAYSFGFDGGAKSEIYFEISSVNVGFSSDVGSSNVAVNYF